MHCHSNLFVVHQEEYFNAETYLSFVDGVLLPHYYRRRHRVYLIQGQRVFSQEARSLGVLCEAQPVNRGVFAAPLFS
jgi:hypothetical protein